MDFIFSTSFDWIMAVILLIVTVLINIPQGGKIVDSLTPKDKFNNKIVLEGDARRRYIRMMSIFFGGLALIEVSAAILIPIWPFYAIAYIVLILIDLLWFAFANKKL